MTKSRNNILVTGGAGFIGSQLVQRLAQANNRLTVIDNLSTGSLKNLEGLQSKIKFIKSDLGRALKANLKLQNFDIIYHLAANPYIPPSVKNPKYDFEQNLMNTFLLLEVLRETANPPCLVNVSSAAVYGNPEKLPIKEGDATLPVSPYGVSKLAAERYATVYSRLYGLKTMNLRYFPAFGPGQKKQVIFDLILKLKKNPNRLDIYGDGSQTRDFTFVDDIVTATILVGKKGVGSGEAYNIATGKSYSIKKLVKVICKVYRLKPALKYTGINRPGDTEKWEADITKIKKLGFKPAYSLEQGILKIKKWMDGEGEMKNIYDK